MPRVRPLLALLMLCPALSALAQTVSRCEDEHGHLTFTTQQCPPETLQSLHRAYHPFLSRESERTATRERDERKRLDAELKRMSEDL
ncbi:hypothetical protein PMM47T1_25758 [Pseudomonas sp. M47T1]|uniref:DUF4124 domain-containing protein n=1 Tax=Pseudomonas sp. M47T1 TaxID=1179778 RepID=UPI0002608387|nr:DUF4124 domain-containing protein [Pseudomonas sp. M47T1]EIK93731.1 hypothetical protein PMM47T1_25758 [Pseudomonas sp. M47T1]